MNDNKALSKEQNIPKGGRKAEVATLKIKKVWLLHQVDSWFHDLNQFRCGSLQEILTIVLGVAAKLQKGEGFDQVVCLKAETN